ncbi:hypothetical protein [Alphabaculovirus myunipunctae]|uniref:Ac18-like protein n=1 Tax=Mythimna unipuncta nucleopolyhedrovirus TaxID=447897 RepID=A0A2K9VS95_9ABAC|nr:hypothetical protein [Mythimna unipuncta nucleopolyhedrovirus]AUV65314.1 hypothetical protein [Mythimna unipuncta nucleopolyhedrovirus]
MESLLQRLFVDKTIPYISKKHINDELGENVLRRTDQSFHRDVLKQTIEALDTLCVVKGGAAIAAHSASKTAEASTSLTDIDVEVYVDDDRANVNNLNSFVALTRLETQLRKVCSEYYEKIDECLGDVDLNCLINNIVCGGGGVGDDNNDNVIIFKSYVNEAVKVSAGAVRFTLNRKMPFKSTVSLVNEDYFLVRYSFNVHMKSDNGIMWLYKSHNRIQSLDYFPFDVYFLDVSVKRSPMPFTDAYSLTNLFGIGVYVEDLKFLIADQIECLMFNVFNRVWHKIQVRTARLKTLLKLYNNSSPTIEERQRYRRILIGGDGIADDDEPNKRYGVRDVKQLLYAVGPLGAQLLIELYFANRFHNSIDQVTHQINFPYHRWDGRFFSKCWKCFLDILNRLYNLGYDIQK